MKSKKGQEEIVGFAVIIIIVAIVLLIFLSISLGSKEKEAVESYEIQSFIQALLQHTSNCRDSNNIEYLSIQKLIFSCYSGDKCLDGEDTCVALEGNLEKIFEEYWMYGEDRPIKGRKMEIIADGDELLVLEDGNVTFNSQGAVQEFFRGGNEISINFEIYY